MTKKKKQKRIGVFGYAGEKETCPICNKRRQRFHNHHITYSPVKEVRICSWCHEYITKRNTLHAGWVGRKLTNEEREEIWDRFYKFSSGYLNKHSISIRKEKHDSKTTQL